MKFESHQSDLVTLVLQIAREWLRLGVLCDLTVICGGAKVEKSFQCHKILLWLKQFCSSSCPAEAEVVILPDIDPQEFQNYLNPAYGYAKEVFLPDTV